MHICRGRGGGGEEEKKEKRGGDRHRESYGTPLEREIDAGLQN